MKFKVGDRIRNLGGGGRISKVIDIVDFKGMGDSDSGPAYALDDGVDKTFLRLKYEDTMEIVRITACYATLEPNIHNTDACAATVYFDELPTDEDVRFAFSDFTDLFRKSQGGAWPNVGPIGNEGNHVDEFWAAPNALSKFRYQTMAG